MPVLKAAPNMSDGKISAGQRMLGEHISSEIAAAREQIVRELKADLQAVKSDVAKVREELASQQLGLMAIGRNIGNDVRKSLEAVTGVSIGSGSQTATDNGATAAQSRSRYTGPGYVGNTASETQSSYAQPEPAPAGYQQQGGQNEWDMVSEFPDTQEAQKELAKTQEMGFNDFVDVNAAKEGLPEAPTPQDEPQYAPVSAQWSEEPQAISGSPNEQYFGLPKKLRKSKGPKAPSPRTSREELKAKPSPGASAAASRGPSPRTSMDELNAKPSPEASAATSRALIRAPSPRTSRDALKVKPSPPASAAA
jgi:hypothetical protein